MKQTAQGLAALGRGPDTQLVHMAPSEVAGLQALAMKHGGSLTINPDTGLPEAGFLSSILPMVLGAGAMMIPGLQGVGAGWIGAGIGGLTTLATGSLSKGLMAGLGAYGGAGLAGGLMGAGTGAASSAAGAAGAAGAGTVVPVAATEAVGSGIADAVSQTAVDAAGQIVPNAAYSAAPQTAVDAFGSTIPNPAFSPVQTFTQAPALSQPAADIGNAYAQEQAAQNAVAKALADPTKTMGAGLTAAGNAPGAFLKANAMPLGAMGLSALGSMQPDELNAPEASKGMIRPYTYSREKIPGAFEDVAGAPRSSKERRYFTDQFTAGAPYAAPGPEYMAAGGPVEAMSNANAIGASTGFPQSDIRTGAYSNPFQQPMGQNVVTGAQDAAVDPYTGQAQFAVGGGVSDLGGYSDGGRLLRGPNTLESNGTSDSIPATIGSNRNPARLAEGEFVIPARIVSELGNGSTEAGAKQLYAMMDRVQKARRATTGKKKVAHDAKARNELPA